MIESSFEDSLSTACPSCRRPFSNGADALWTCQPCGIAFPGVAGLPDLRLNSDRYLDLEADRAKAERLHGFEPSTDLMGLASAYYAITDDVLDHRRDRFLRHIAGADARGEALAERLPKHGRVLELGCGTGGLLVAATRLGVAIEGVDVASRWLVVARRRLTDCGLCVRLIAAEAESLPYTDQSFDAVVADSLIEHLDDPARALREWNRVLRPGGRLIVWSPNRYTLTVDPHLGLWGLGWLPRTALPAYVRLRGRDEWVPTTLSARGARSVAIRCGFRQVTTEPPAVPARWGATRPAHERLPIFAYSAARQNPATRALLRAVGPLWELTATKEIAA